MKSLHNLARDILSLIKEERDYTLKELSNSYHQQLGEAIRDWFLSMLDGVGDQVGS